MQSTDHPSLFTAILRLYLLCLKTNKQTHNKKPSTYLSDSVINKINVEYRLILDQTMTNSANLEKSGTIRGSSEGHLQVNISCKTWCDDSTK